MRPDDNINSFMAPYVSWIKTALENAFPQVDDVDQGVDLNGNRQIEETEKVTSYGGDWLAFYRAHATELKQLGGIFEWGQYFKPDNPIHDFLTIASEDRPEEELELAYEKLDAIRYEVQHRVTGRELPPQELLKTFEDSMRSVNIRPTVLDHETNPLINLGIGFSDWSDTAFLVLALAHENGWPVSIVRERYQPDARWKGTPGTMTLVTPACFKCGPVDATGGFLGGISEVTIQGGVYMADLDRTSLLSTFFTLRGKQRGEAGDTQGAREDFSQAIRLDRKNVAAYTELSSLEYRTQRFFDALHDASTATQLDPDNYMAWYLIGLAAEELKNYETAQLAYSRIISNASRLNDADLRKPEVSAGYQGLARVRYAQGDYRGTIEACQQALTLQRASQWRGEIFYLIGSAHLALGKNSHDESERYFEFNLAATAYQQAMGEGKGSYETHLGLGSAQVELGLYREVINELTAAIKIKDSNPDIYILRGRAYEALDLDEQATQDYRRSAFLRLKQQ